MMTDPKLLSLLARWRETDGAVRALKARKRIPTPACTCATSNARHQVGCAIEEQKYAHERVFWERDWAAASLARYVSKLERRSKKGAGR